MKRLLILPLLIVLLCIQYAGFAQQAGQQVPIKIPATNSVTNALLYLPWDYNTSGKKYPLICFFHGMGEAGDGGSQLSKLATQGLPGVIKQGKFPYSVSNGKDTTRFIVLSIQASWFSPTPETMIAGISSLTNDYHLRIDANRIYSTGLSAGGQQSLYAIMNYPSKFAAAVVMSPAAAITKSKVDSFAHNYIWFFQGTTDQTVPPTNAYNSNDWINAQYPGHSKLTKYPSGHCCWMPYYDPEWKENGLSIYDFMLQHTLSNEAPEPPKNKPPQASAGTNQTITLPVNSVKLDGSGSSDTDGTIASYKWAQSSGPSTATFSSTSNATPTVSKLIAGVYVFELTVKDNSGSTATDKTQVTVKSQVSNQLPKANAGGYQTITSNSAKLDGSGSYDPDGSLASYKWVQFAGPSTAVFSSTTTAMPTVSNLVSGVYTFDLTVTDNVGSSATGRTQVTVKIPSNQPPKADPGANQTITLPTNSVKLNASKSYDPDGNIASYKWTQSAGPSNATLSSATSATPTASSLITGVYSFTLAVTDNSGSSATAKTEVTVKPASNKPPKANAGGYQTITTNSATLNGSGSYDPDGTIASYKWVQFAGPNDAAFSSTSSATPTVSHLVTGIYTFDLTVTDNGGSSTTGRTQVTVKTITANKPPKANAGGYQTITLPKNSVQLNASRSYDPDGSILDYKWTQFAGPTTATFSSTSSATPTVSNLKAGVYVFDLAVKDNGGASTTGRTQVTVFGASGISALHYTVPFGDMKPISNFRSQDSLFNDNNPALEVGISDGLKTDGSKSGLILYPNPVHNMLRVSFQVEAAGKIAFRIVSMNGQVMKTFHYTEPSGQASKILNMEGLDGGVYLIQLLENNQLRATRKVIKY